MSILLAPQLYETIAKKAKEFLTWDNIKNAASEAWNFMYDKGKAILDWVVDKLGLGKAIAKAGDALAALGSAVDWLKDKLGFNTKKQPPNSTTRRDTNAHGTTVGGSGQRKPVVPLTAEQQAKVDRDNAATLAKDKTSVVNASKMVGKGAAAAGGAIASGAESAGSSIAAAAPGVGSALASGAQTVGSTIASGASALINAKSSGHFVGKTWVPATTAPTTNTALATPPAPGTPGSGYNSGAIDFGDGGAAGHATAVTGHAWAKGNNSPANSYTNLSAARGETTSAPATSVSISPAVTVPTNGPAPTSTATPARAATVAQSTSTVGINSFGISSGVDDSLALMNLGVISG